MPVMSETKFKERVLKDLKAFGDDVEVLKTQERGRKGVPDLIICLRGKYVAIELKRVGKDATPLQKHRISRIKKAGGLAFVADADSWFVQLAVLKAY